MAVEKKKRKSFKGDSSSGPSSSSSPSFSKNKKAKTSKGPPTKSSSSSGDAENSNLSSSAQKRALKQERQSRRRHADVVAEAKLIWNQLRLRDNEPDQIEKQATKLSDLLQGKLAEVALQHDASRVVQAVIKHGTPTQRREAVKELAKGIPELSKVQYAHFVVLKMIQSCHRDDECVRLIVKSMKGSIPKLAVHAVGARVLELLFGTFPNKVTVSLRQELYGPHFSLFASSDMATSVDNTKGKKNEKKTTTTKKNANDAPVGTLRSNLAAHPNKTDVTIEFVGNILQKGAEKSLFGFRYYQELFAEYIDVAPSSVLRKGGLISNVVDHSVHLLSTRAGTKVVAACVAYGTPKDRKKVLKSLKGYTRSSLLHRDAYLAVLRILQVTDDTVSLHKSVLAELLKDTAANDSSNNNNGDDDNDDEDQESSPMLELALHENASKLFLTLLVADCDAQKYLDPYEREILKANPTYVEGNEEIPTSKKNPETRRKELVLYLKQPLIRLCTDHTEELLRSLPGARVLKEVYSNYATAELVDALVQVCLDAVTTKHEGDNEEQPTMLFEDQIAHFSIKNIFQCDTSTANAGSKDKNKQQRFATAFLKELEPHLGKVGSSNRGAFVLTALCKAEPAAVKAVSKYKKAIIAHKKKAKKSTAGYEALLKELSGKKVSTARH